MLLITKESRGCRRFRRVRVSYTAVMKSARQSKLWHTVTELWMRYGQTEVLVDTVSQPDQCQKTIVGAARCPHRARMDVKVREGRWLHRHRHERAHGAPGRANKAFLIQTVALFRPSMVSEP